MKNRGISIACALVVAAGVLVGCNEMDGASVSMQVDDATQVEAATPDNEVVIGKEAGPVVGKVPSVSATGANELQVPPQWRFMSIAEVRRAPSWDDRVSQLPTSEGAWLRERNDQYAHALEFDSPEEQQRLIAQGFPMPEEWIAAKSMSTMELEALAKAGSNKAQMFYVDRVSDEIGSIRQSGQGLETSSSQDMALLSKAAAANTMVLRLMRSTGSPFAAYLDGRITMAMTQYSPPESMASAIMLAGDLGDVRSSDLRARYFHAHPDMDAAVITQTYEGRKRLVQRRGLPPSP